MREAWVIDGVRTPIGRHGGGLASVRPDDLAALTIEALLERTGLDPETIDDVLFGCINQAGEDNRNVARMALLRAGLHPTGGGCLCLAGDCPHCLVTVDGVAYVRSCQTRVAEGMSVAREHLGGAHPPLFRRPDPEPPPVLGQSDQDPRIFRCDRPGTLDPCLRFVHAACPLGQVGPVQQGAHVRRVELDRTFESSQGLTAVPVRCLDRPRRRPLTFLELRTLVGLSGSSGPWHPQHRPERL